MGKSVESRELTPEVKRRLYAVLGTAAGVTLVATLTNFDYDILTALGVSLAFSMAVVTTGAFPDRGRPVPRWAVHVAFAFAVAMIGTALVLRLSGVSLP
jgi:hypothetical protein